MSATVQCSATVQTAVTGEVQCVDGTGAAVAWTVVPDFDPSQVDTTIAGSAFSAGFVLVGTAWAIGKGISLVLSQIRR